MPLIKKLGSGSSGVSGGKAAVLQYRKNDAQAFNATPAAVNFTINQYNTLDDFSIATVTSVSPFELRADRAGFFHIHVTTFVQNSVGNEWQQGDSVNLHLYKNGSLFTLMSQIQLQEFAVVPAYIDAMHINGASLIELAVNDTIKVFINASRTSTGTTDSDNQYLFIEYLGDT